LWLYRQCYTFSQINLLRQPYIKEAKRAVFHCLRQHAAFAICNIGFNFFFISHGVILSVGGSGASGATLNELGGQI